MFESAEPRSLADRRADATRRAVLDAAWSLSRKNGLTGWSLRDLAKAVGLAAPTLYAYFGSKHAIYDAMFKDGFEAFERATAEWEAAAGTLPPREAFRRAAHEHMRFCTADPTRYQLMFQRVIPDFVPGEDAYAVSLAAYERFRRQVGRVGVTDGADLDLWTALSTGLTDQQISNDPGGDRWIRLIDRAVDLFCDHVGIPAEGDSA